MVEAFSQHGDYRVYATHKTDGFSAYVLVRTFSDRAPRPVLAFGITRQGRYCRCSVGRAAGGKLVVISPGGPRDAKGSNSTRAERIINALLGAKNVKEWLL